MNNLLNQFFSSIMTQAMTKALGTQDRTESVETLGNTLSNSPPCMLDSALT